MRVSVLSLVLSAAVAATACGGAQTSPDAPEGEQQAETTEQPAPALPAEVEFDEMSREQKLSFMKDVVLPEMKTLFSEVDPSYAEMTCKTCHGPGAEQGKFDMPNADLPKLTTTGGFEAEMEAKPAVTKFMMEKVVPKMAELLREEPYNPETKKGFGCFDCHTPKE